MNGMMLWFYSHHLKNHRSLNQITIMALILIFSLKKYTLLNQGNIIKLEKPKILDFEVINLKFYYQKSMSLCINSRLMTHLELKNIGIIALPTSVKMANGLI